MGTKLQSHPLSSILTLLCLLTTIQTYTDPAACIASTNYYDSVTLSCTTCPTSTQQATDKTYCNCSNTHYPNPSIIGFNDASSCTALGTTYTKTTQIVPVYNLDGSVATTPVVATCVSSYPDSTNTRCIPCGPSTSYNTATSSCICSTAGQVYVGGACYTYSLGTYTPTITSPAIDSLAQSRAVVACGQHSVIQACNQLMNKCIEGGINSAIFCTQLATLQTTKSPATGLPIYKFSAAITTSISIFASSIVGTNTSTIKNTFQFILAEYNLDGSMNDLKTLDSSIFACYLSPQDIVNIQSFGLHFTKTCNTPRTFATIYYYDVYVIDASGNYNQVPLFYNGQYFKRFRPSSFNSIEISLLSIPPLRTPLFTLTNQAPALIHTNSNAQSTTINFTPFLAVFGVFIALFFAIDFFRYLRYNPDENNDPYYCFKVIAMFMVHIVKFIGVGIWLWLLAFSGYCFCFYKFQQTVYLILPSPLIDTTGLYSSFASFFYITYSFTLLGVFILFFKMVSYTDFFLIDWEKQKQTGKFQVGRNRNEVSVWRKVLVVNQLYELSMNRIINIEFISLFSILFLQGLEWIHLNANIPTTSPLQTDNTLQNNPILAYFIITFVVLAISLGQFILRHAVKTWMPLASQNFVDLCSICNVSIIIFDQTLHGYYIHGMNPMGQSEGSLQYIDNMFEKQAKSFGKSRSFKLEDVDQCQTFQVIFPMEVRQAYQMKYVSKYNQKLVARGYGTSIMADPIPESLNQEDYTALENITKTMLETFKFYLQGIKTSSLNVRQRSLLEKLVDCPMDPQTMGKLPVFFKDMWLQFQKVMLGGHQFILLFNYINFINIFYIATKNAYYAFFIAFIFQKIFTFIIGIFIKRNISRNTRIDDKFFN